MQNDKEAYYFSHDSNAKDDPNCMLLIDQLGLEGYGGFWVLVELLRDQPDYKYPIKLIPAIARRYNITAEKLQAVVSNYKLFKIDNENFFFSESLIRRMKHLDKVREKRRLAGIESGKKRKLLAQSNKCSTNVQQMSNKNEQSKEKKNTIKENKENNVTNIIDYLNEKAETNYKSSTKETIRLINAKLNSGFTKEDFFRVIDNKVKDWKGKSWEDTRTGDFMIGDNFLRPQTLFGTKFESYLNQKQNGNTNQEQPIMKEFKGYN